MIFNGSELLSAAFSSTMMLQGMRTSHVKLLYIIGIPEKMVLMDLFVEVEILDVSQGVDKCGESETENSSSDWSNKEFGELQLSVKSDDCHPSVKVKKCGIRILYEKDLEDTNEDSAVSGPIANGPLIKRKRIVYEETEAGSQPKRMEWFFNFMMGRPGKKH
ncbi:hypothetical protein F3Y22_tig00009009pilonHSYRG00107 [Hibiscus syriacus]|uniref:Uncharacterized protein n=1 Tax=Hibiscus syriacus TaxID=106335 RepID=A0A6A3C786_HIBSY|nr:hypothetical protein F3Y22_tig00009009pilonHSYRG00107 [Hibiscus syriacus]